MAAILKIFKYETQLQFDIRCEKIVPNYAKTIFHSDDIIDDVTWRPKICPIYSCLEEVGSGSHLQGQCLVNKCEYRKCHSRLFMPKEDLINIFCDRRSKVNVTGLLCVLGT